MHQLRKELILTQSFYWHDYETWGANPSVDRPVQFAGLRTDWELNVIAEPQVWYARPADDMLPQPEACLLTGITPQFATQHGQPEAQFIAHIHQELAHPGTCGVGYNSLRFDDEITRFTLFRNFFDPYSREWRNGNSRWDLIDVMRLAHALRPEGINWPYREGRVSFRLQDLSAANNLIHDAAHDALSDVRATIDLARLLRLQQPRLFEFALGLRDKQRVRKLLECTNAVPMLHVSSKYPAERGCIAPVLAVAAHPTDKNGVIVIDLRSDPELLLDLSVEAIKQRVFTRKEDLPFGIERVPLKVVHVNRVPMLAPMITLTEQAAERWAINRNQVQINAARLQATPELHVKLQQVFVTPTFPPRAPEQNLYGGLLNDADLIKCATVRATKPEDLGNLNLHFKDARLNAMLLHYRARNWPETLTQGEREQWNQYRQWRITDPVAGASITLNNYLAEIAKLRLQQHENVNALKILQALEDWVDTQHLF